jgi:hypothetical protein
VLLGELTDQSAAPNRFLAARPCDIVPAENRVSEIGN